MISPGILKRRAWTLAQSNTINGYIYPFKRLFLADCMRQVTIHTFIYIK